MAIFFLKPVVWNDSGYQSPGGGKFTSGYPAENGFGHEEWNNSDRLNFSDSAGRQLHAFHTEGFGKQNLDQFVREIFVFMIASFSGRQFLVSIAGSATALFGQSHRKERDSIFQRLGIGSEFPEDAWRVPSIQAAFRGDRSKFMRAWKRENQWFANWTCPANLYLGLSRPIELDPISITGRKRLVSMYNSYQEIDRPTALRLLDLAQKDANGSVASELILACGNNASEIAEDVGRVNEKATTRETTKRRLIDARLGQGGFRTQLNARWGDRCAVTGCGIAEILRASHIKPWRSSTNPERLDPENGILLAAHLDALFDAGLITFDEFGEIERSELLIDKGNPKLDVQGRLRATPSSPMKKYLEYHRSRVFRRRPR